MKHPPPPSVIQPDAAQWLPSTARKLCGALLTRYRWQRANAGSLPDIRRARIALVKLDGIGDFVLGTTFLHVFRRLAPAASVTLVCRSPVGGLARQQYPGWEVIELPPRGRPLQTIYRQKRERRALQALPPFDLLVDLRTFRDMSDSAVSSWIRAGVKIAPKNAYRAELPWVTTPFEERIYDRVHDVPPPDSPGLCREIQSHRTMAGMLFPQVPETSHALPSLAVPEPEREAVAALLASRLPFDARRPFLLVCPGVSTPTREYPIGALADALQRTLAEHRVPVVIAGTNADLRTTGPLAEALRGQATVVDLTGVLNLVQHTCLVSLAQVVLAMDSCHAHIAGALGKPAVVVIGGGHYGVFTPWGEAPAFRWLTNKLPCFGCHWQCIYDRPLCIHDVPAHEIARNLGEVFRAVNVQG